MVGIYHFGRVTVFSITEVQLLNCIPIMYSNRIVRQKKSSE